MTRELRILVSVDWFSVYLQNRHKLPEGKMEPPLINGTLLYSAAMSAQHTIALQTELQRPNPLYI
jgi:hypothetical protein